MASLLPDHPPLVSAQRTTAIAMPTASRPGRATTQLTPPRPVTSPGMPTIVSWPDDSPPLPTPETVQRAVQVIQATAEPAAAASTEVPLPAEGPPITATPPPQPPPAPPSPEELLKTLFDPLYRRLRAELRKDRDRRGLITDLRR
ncbi:hypothetical protein AB0C12_05920 [Actinoplanes sp. NPDC048967]|uniref:hypothetical protein n=1 Tax=Actinoplanes sp. NPDC048967 TaxID=3155269 RepID=UPI0033FB293B